MILSLAMVFSLVACGSKPAEGTVTRMTVPCCGGMPFAVKRALEAMLPGLSACYCYAGISPTYHDLPNEQVLKLKSIEAMQVVANGQATKIIIPSEMQGLVGLANGIVEGVKE